MVCRKCRREVPEGRFCALCGADQDPPPKKRRALRRPNGTGTVYKLQGRRKRPWVAAKDKVIIGCYYETRTAALEALARVVDKDITERFNMTFKEVFNEWKEEHYKDISESLKRSYNRAFDLSAKLYNEKFRDLRTKDFQAIINENNGKSNSSLSKLKVLWTQMAKWALREEIIYIYRFRPFCKIAKRGKGRKASVYPRGNRTNRV